MYTFEKSIFINLPQQEVFDYLTDPANDGKWRKTSVSSEWTSEGPVGVGSTQHSVDKFLGRNIESDSEITVWDPPNEYGWKSVGGPIPYELSMKFTPDGGGTQISFGGQAELGGLAAEHALDHGVEHDVGEGLAEVGEAQRALATGSIG